MLLVFLTYSIYKYWNGELIILFILYILSLTITLNFFEALNGNDPEFFIIKIFLFTARKIPYLQNKFQKIKNAHLIPLWMRFVMIIGPIAFIIIIDKI